MKNIFAALFTSIALANGAYSQQLSREFSITQVTPELVTTPEYSFNFGPKNKKVAKNKEWLEIEVTFDWQPKAKEPRFLDELTVNYYVLLSDNRDPKKNTLLTGSVTHTAIPQEKGMKSVMYVSPRTLERFFEGKTPTTAASAVFNVGVTLTQQGQLVAESSWKGDSRSRQWWTGFQQVSGYVLNKNETPFAPLAWDYYEAIKARPSGQ